MEGRRAVAVAGLGVAAAAAAALAFAATTRRLRPDDGATRDESDRPLHITVGDMELLDRAFNGLVPAAAQTEHDALHTAEFVRSMLHGQTSGKHVLVLVGSGGNGAAGLATARRLLAWGTSVTVVLCAGRQKLKGYAKEAIAAIDAMGALSPRLCRVLDASEVADECTAVPGVGATWSAAVASERLFGPDSRGVPVDLMIDAIFGYSLRGPPRPLQAAVVKAANAHPSPVVAIGVPSGLDLSRGVVLQPCIKAVATIDVVLPKVGTRSPAARAQMGKYFVADVGLPPQLIRSTLALSAQEAERTRLFERVSLVQVH